jgi:peptidyl-prolyl cis-trans isomerase SurA
VTAAFEGQWRRVGWIPVLALVAAALTLPAGRPARAAERIAAIVNKSVILASEVDERFAQAAARFNIDPGDTQTVAKLRHDVLEQLIENQIILDEAVKLGITVTPQEVNQAVDREIDAVRERLGGEEAFQRALREEQTTEADLRQRYAPDVKDQLMISRAVAREVQSKTTVSDGDVRQFFEANRDSIGRRPEQLDLAHIMFAYEPDSQNVRRARAKADSLRGVILKGKPFEEIARQFSDDPSGQRGGDLGMFGRGDMVPEFEQVAFELKPGEVSRPVRTRFGFHIIKVEKHEAATDSTQERVQARHVMIGLRPTPADEERARKRAMTVRDSLMKGGADFAVMARRYSQDTATKDSGGALGEISAGSLPANLREVLTGLSIGEVSVPVRRDTGYHLFKLLARKPEEDYKFEDIKDQLRQMVLNRKLEETYRRWYERIRKTASVEIKE